MNRTAHTLTLWLTLTAPFAGAPLAAVDGTPDPSFGSDGRRRVFFDLAGTLGDYGNAVGIDAFGRIVVVGTVDNGSLGTDCGVARLLPDGTLDTSFDGDGLLTWDLSPQFTHNDSCTDVVVNAIGEILAAGSDGVGRIHVHDFPSAIGFFVAESHDSPPQIALQPDAKILVGWSDGDFHVCRYQHLLTPVLDPQFGSGGCVEVAFDLGGGLRDDLYDLVLQPDGKLLLAGSAEWGGGDTDFAVARLNPGGALDAGFGFGGKLAIAFDLAGGSPDFARSVAVGENGKIVLAGGAGTGLLAFEAAIATVASDGSFFSTAHFLLGQSESSQASGALVQDDGKIVFAGSARTNGEVSYAVERLLPNLTADPDFLGGVYGFDPVNPGDDWANGLALDAGRPVLVGAVEWSDPDFDFGVLRLENGLIFADGFGRGSTGHWSSTAP